jgi:hypothetical protein
MTPDPITLVTATSRTREQYYDTPLAKCQAKLRMVARNLSQMVFYSNARSLASQYNYAIMEQKKGIVVFVHDDVSIEDTFFREKIEAGLERHAIVGLAGSTEMVIQSPAMWHLGSPRERHSGTVNHPCNANQVFASAFGPTPQRCLVMDGLFLACKVEALMDTKTFFDESNPARFHFYDLDFCLTANRNRLKLTTAPIHVVHSSPGLTKPDEEFAQGEEWFIKKWK